MRKKRSKKKSVELLVDEILVLACFFSLSFSLALTVNLNLGENVASRVCGLQFKISPTYANITEVIMVLYKLTTEV